MKGRKVVRYLKIWKMAMENGNLVFFVIVFFFFLFLGGGEARGRRANSTLLRTKI